jgi:UDPglucose 6-dehydrogenase
MKIGFIGLGKLGLPVAYVLASAGHEVYGYDINKSVANYISGVTEVPFQEEGLSDLMSQYTVNFCDSPMKVVDNSDIVFVAVQTPHEPQFEGATRIPEDRRDFNYEWLKTAIAEVSAYANIIKKRITLVTISTCLPGTFKKEIEPLLTSYIDYVYNPFFIAMGTVIHDFTHPEFVLIGRHWGVQPKAMQHLLDVYEPVLHDREGKAFITDITTAEGIKVFYNTFITTKTVLANTYGEMAHKMGMNVDHIYEALSRGTDRITSPKYLKAGMGDGGGCHPRDNIALSYLAEKMDMSHNIFDDLMQAREDHAEWLADLCLEHSPTEHVTILGKAFKPETNIETGSPAVLVANILKEKGADVNHVEDLSDKEPNAWGVVLIGTEHERYKTYNYAPGTTVIDPFGYLSPMKGVNLISVGRPHKSVDLRDQ